MKLILIVGLFTIAAGLRVKSKTNAITQQNTDLLKYSENDEYTLPENIDDDDDQPPNHYHGDNKLAHTLSLENHNQGKGKFKYSLATQNGIELNQVGKLKDGKTFIVSGSYSYTGADGKRYRVRYTADELGYHPITELDVDIPEIVMEIDENGNRGFQFLNQRLGLRNQAGSAQLVDDFSYKKTTPAPLPYPEYTQYPNDDVNTSEDGYTYNVPELSSLYLAPDVSES